MQVSSPTTNQAPTNQAPSISTVFQLGDDIHFSLPPQTMADQAPDKAPDQAPDQAPDKAPTTQAPVDLPDLPDLPEPTEASAGEAPPPLSQEDIEGLMDDMSGSDSEEEELSPLPPLGPPPASAPSAEEMAAQLDALAKATAPEPAQEDEKETKSPHGKGGKGIPGKGNGKTMKMMAVAPWANGDDETSSDDDNKASESDVDAEDTSSDEESPKKAKKRKTPKKQKGAYKMKDPKKRVRRGANFRSGQSTVTLYAITTNEDEFDDEVDEEVQEAASADSVEIDDEDHFVLVGKDLSAREVFRQAINHWSALRFPEHDPDEEGYGPENMNRAQMRARVRLSACAGMKFLTGKHGDVHGDIIRYLANCVVGGKLFDPEKDVDHPDNKRMFIAVDNTTGKVIDFNTVSKVMPYYETYHKNAKTCADKEAAGKKDNSHLVLDIPDSDTSDEEDEDLMGLDDELKVYDYKRSKFKTFDTVMKALSTYAPRVNIPKVKSSEVALGLLASINYINEEEEEMQRFAFYASRDATKPMEDPEPLAHGPYLKKKAKKPVGKGKGRGPMMAAAAPAPKKTKKRSKVAEAVASPTSSASKRVRTSSPSPTPPSPAPHADPVKPVETPLSSEDPEVKSALGVLSLFNQLKQMNESVGTLDYTDQSKMTDILHVSPIAFSHLLFKNEELSRLIDSAVV